MNARRGAATYNRNKIEECKKKELREKFHSSLLTSAYFEYFDETNPKHMSTKQKYYLQIAAEVAMNSVMNHKHGAIIVHKKNIIAVGYNYLHSTFSIHAEIAAITCLKGKEKVILPECELYVVRIGPKKYDNALKYSKPCMNCQNYIAKKCIKKTFYSTNYSFDEIACECMNSKNLQCK